MGLTAFHGFCMALADSVPGVSGGTIAFILGFYDRFLDALHQLFGKDKDARRAAVRYLLQLGLGWVVGMVASVAALAELFASQVYFMSSLFLGLTLASFPFVIRAEQSPAPTERTIQVSPPRGGVGLLALSSLLALPGRGFGRGGGLRGRGAGRCRG